MSIEEDIKIIEDAGGDTEDVKRYLSLKGYDFSVKNAQKSPVENVVDWASKDVIGTIKNVQGVAGKVNEIRAERQQPTRLEQYLEKTNPEAYKKTNQVWQTVQKHLKGVPGTSGAPTPFRLPGEAIDIPVDLIQSFMGALKQTSPSNAFNPANPKPWLEQASKAGEMVKQVGQNIAGSAASTAVNPAQAMSDRPLQSAMDIYPLKAGAEALGKAAKLTEPMVKPTSSAKVYYDIGQKIDNGLKEIKTKAGEAVGAETKMIEDMTKAGDLAEKLSTKDLFLAVIKKITDKFTSKGQGPFTPTDLKKIKLRLDELKGDGDFMVSSSDLLKIRKNIDELDINWGKPGEILKESSTSGKGAFLDMRNGIRDLLVKNDPYRIVDSAGNVIKEGSLAPVYKKFSEIADLYDEARSIFGKELSLGRKIKIVGQDLIKGEPAMTDLVTKIENFMKKTPSLKGKAEFIKELRIKARADKAAASLKKTPFLGAVPRYWEMAKDRVSSWGERYGSPLDVPRAILGSAKYPGGAGSVEELLGNLLGGKK